MENTNSKSRVEVQATHHSCDHIANPGFQDPHRAESYLITQRFVVPKAQLFQYVYELLERVAAKCNGRLRILEPGIGPGLFETFLLGKDNIAAKLDFEFVGLDVSKEMIDLAVKRIQSSLPAKSIQRARFLLHSGIDCLKLDDALLSVGQKGQKFSAIVTSQFEHYFPNDNQSNLAEELRRAGLGYHTKRQSRELAFELLDKGGVYVAIDDYDSEDKRVNEISELFWDLFVLRNLANLKIQDKIMGHDPELGSMLRRRYGSDRDLSELLNQIKVFRQHRRHICREETQVLSEAKRDLEEIFGRENVNVLRHPRRDSLSRFHLLYAIKR